MTRDEYLTLIDKIKVNNITEEDVRSLAVSTYNGINNCKKNGKEITELNRQGLDALIQNGTYIKALENSINNASELYENGILVRPSSNIDLQFDFFILNMIKTPESVKLLGEYLYDDRNAKPKVKWEPGMDIAPNDSVSNSGAAAKELQTMGIKNPPQPDLRGYAIIDSWKLWFEQVKAGNRVFSFEGENIAYRLKKDGTFEKLDAAAAKEINHLANNKQNSTDSNAPTTTRRKTTWIVFTSLLVALAAIYYVKFRNVSGKITG